MNTFGSTLLRRREALLVSQSDLARRMGRAASTVSRWEAQDGPSHRRVTPMEIKEIAGALHEDNPQSDLIAAEEYLLLIAAGYLPPEAQQVMSIPVVAALAMAWDSLDEDQRDELEATISAMLERWFLEE